MDLGEAWEEGGWSIMISQRVEVVSSNDMSFSYKEDLFIKHK